jgi:hypothetical protein
MTGSPSSPGPMTERKATCEGRKPVVKQRSAKRCSASGARRTAHLIIQRTSHSRPGSSLQALLAVGLRATQRSQTALVRATGYRKPALRASWVTSTRTPSMSVGAARVGLEEPRKWISLMAPLKRLRNRRGEQPPCRVNDR